MLSTIETIITITWFVGLITLNPTLCLSARRLDFCLAKAEGCKLTLIEKVQHGYHHEDLY
jgi:uncharacterized membrane protein YhaH (DUF805 family)